MNQQAPDDALAEAHRLDFRRGRDGIPPEWKALREEARPHFARRTVAEADVRMR